MKITKRITITALARLIIVVAVCAVAGVLVFNGLANSGTWLANPPASSLSSKATETMRDVLAYEQRPSRDALSRLQSEVEELQSSISEVQRHEVLREARLRESASCGWQTLCLVWLIFGAYATWISVRDLTAGASSSTE